MTKLTIIILLCCAGLTAQAQTESSVSGGVSPFSTAPTAAVGALALPGPARGLAGLGSLRYFDIDLAARPYGACIVSISALDGVYVCPGRGVAAIAARCGLAAIWFRSAQRNRGVGQ